MISIQRFFSKKTQKKISQISTKKMKRTLSSNDNYSPPSKRQKLENGIANVMLVDDKWKTHPVIDYTKSFVDNQGTEKWLKERSSKITASAMASCLPRNVRWANPYACTLSYLLGKLGFSNFEGNDATKHGNFYENIAIAAYQHYVNADQVHFCGLVPHRDPEMHWIGGSPDGITESGVLLEVKCPVYRFLRLKEDYDEGKYIIPPYYIPQVQMLMEILDVEHTHFIQFIPPVLRYELGEKSTRTGKRKKIVVYDTDQENIINNGFNDEVYCKTMTLSVAYIKRDREWWVKYGPYAKKIWKQIKAIYDHAEVEMSDTEELKRILLGVGEYKYLDQMEGECEYSTSEENLQEKEDGLQEKES
jgi:putative phage-type endonuclease